MASRPSTAPGGQRPALLGLLRTRSGSQRRNPPSSSQSITVDNGRRPSQRIRLVPHLDTPRAYTFGLIVRTLRAGGAPVVIGRLDSIGIVGDNANSTITTGKIAFKSKVVSRAHAEIWMDNGGAVLVRDTQSASGTFLNRTRVTGKWCELRDGDVLQVGVDYQGGLEDVYKAVKMRVEVGREPETAFDTTALRALRALEQTSGKPIIPDCCICLCAISARQALFTTPCSHTFHFVCVRPLLLPPMFTCPVCRTESNLDEEIDDQPQEQEQEQEVLVDIEDRSLPPTPNETEDTPAEVVRESEKAERGRLPSSPSLDWLPEMEFISLDSDFSVTLNNPGGSHAIPSRAPSLPSLRPVARAPSADPSPSTRPRPTHAATLPPGAALPFIPATYVADVPSRTPSPPPPPPPVVPPSLGANWLREMELMQRNSEYIVSHKPSRKGTWLPV